MWFLCFNLERNNCHLSRMQTFVICLTLMNIIKEDLWCGIFTPYLNGKKEIATFTLSCIEFLTFQVAWVIKLWSWHLQIQFIHILPTHSFEDEKQSFEFWSIIFIKSLIFNIFWWKKCQTIGLKVFWVDLWN